MNRFKIYWDRSFTDWRFRLVLHLGFWLFYLFFWMGETMVVSINVNQYYLITLVGSIFILFLYYPLTYLIWPLFKKKKWAWGALVFILYYIIAVILRTYHISLAVEWYNFQRTSVQGGEFWQNILERQLSYPALLRVLFSGFSSLIVLIYIPLTIKFLRYAYQFSQQQAWIMKENTQLQLNTLKAQLNPHFFFNTLNNLQSFIVQNEKEKSVDLLNRLGDFMRASLYEGNQEYITMGREVALLNNYIAIEKVRFEEEAFISTSISTRFPDQQIPPFIFLPFIENALKHGGTLPASQVKIEIELSHHPGRILLKTFNKFATNKARENYQGGIGLKNVSKRLDYYFPGGYHLNFSSVNNTFTVHLEINT